MIPTNKRQIRTLSQLSGRKATEPHRIFMKISILEMEKSRRQQERQNAAQRLQKIDDKIEEIETEIAQLLTILNLPANQTTSQAPTQQATKTESSPPPAGQKFILKY